MTIPSPRWIRDGTATAHEVFRSVREWLERSSLEPFFLWVHLSDPHEPYVPFGAAPDTRLTMDDRILGEWNLVSQEPLRIFLRSSARPAPIEMDLVAWTRPDDRPETCIRLELPSDSREAVTPFMASQLPEKAEEMDMRPSLEWGAHER